jgi:cytochrome c553
MRTFVKILVWAILALVVLVAGAAAAVYALSNSKLHRHYTIAVQVPPVPDGAAAAERGRHLAQTRGCLDCHGADFAGHVVIDNPAMGLTAGPNLTRGRGGLPPQFGPEDWVRAIRHGVGHDGRPLVLMPSAEFAHMSDDDVGAIIAYLESVPKVDRDSIPVRLGPVARALLVANKMPLAAEVVDHAHVEPAQIAPAPTAEYGRYLAVGCTGCHGPNFSGGKIAAGPPDWPPARNLTPAGDLGKWTEADFIRTLRTARRPDGMELSPVMPRAFGQLDDTELRALWAYLHMLPGVPTGQR